MKPSRRQFLACLPLAALPAAGCRRQAAPLPSCVPPPRSTGPGRVLDAEQWATLQAACARLLPSDGEPGATEANVAGFIDEQLTAPPVSSFRGELAHGLRQLDLLARRSGGSGFATLPAEKQDQVLRTVQRGVPMGRGRDSRHFFLVLLTLTLEGFLGDPVYGGNRDEAGWQFLRFKPRPPRPRCPYRS